MEHLRATRCNARTRSKNELIELYKPTDWRIFFKDHFEKGISMKKVVELSGFNETAVLRLFRQDPSYEEYKRTLNGVNRKAQYERIVEASRRLGLVPLFGIDEYKSMQTKYTFKCIYCGLEFKSKVQSTNCAPNLCSHCKNSKYRSKLERWLCEELESRGIEFTHNIRTDVKCERDIQIGNVAFELNGYHYHAMDGLESVTGKDINYHKLKTELCLECGIQLHHIWYTNYNDCNKELILSQVLVKSGNAKTVYARKLKLKKMMPDEAREFFHKYHLDGYVRGEAYALYEGVCPKCAILLNTRRIQSSGLLQFEIGRFASVYNTVVVGGYSKLLKFVVSLVRQRGGTEIISYCNRDVSPDYHNTFYYKYGFKFVGDSGMIYHYYADRFIDFNGKKYKGIVSRQTLQKSKLLEHFKSNGLEIKDDDTEYSMALKLGFRRVFNSGNWKFSLSL